MENTNLKRFRLKNIDKIKTLVSSAGNFNVATLTDEQAEKLYNLEPNGRYIEKIETEEKPAETPKLDTPKKK